MKYLKALESARIKWYKKGVFSSPEEVENDSEDFPYFIIYNKFFTDFLLKNDAYEDFKEELYKQKGVDKNSPVAINNYMKNVRSRSGSVAYLIDLSFTWSRSSTKTNWARLNDELVNIMEKGLIEENAKIRWYKKGEFTDEFIPDETNTEYPIVFTAHSRDNKEIIKNIVLETGYSGYVNVYNVSTFSHVKNIHFDIEFFQWNNDIDEYVGDGIDIQDIRYIILHVLNRFQNNGFEILSLMFHGKESDILNNFNNIEDYLLYNKHTKIFSVNFRFSKNE